jgi:hypothetical protein
LVNPIDPLTGLKFSEIVAMDEEDFRATQLELMQGEEIDSLAPPQVFCYLEDIYSNLPEDPGETSTLGIVGGVGAHPV